VRSILCPLDHAAHQSSASFDLELLHFLKGVKRVTKNPYEMMIILETLKPEERIEDQSNKK
jgi:hypothetical protein